MFCFCYDNVFLYFHFRSIIFFVFFFGSFNTGNTNLNGVATLQYHCEVDKTLTASFGNVSTSCSIISNYVPSVVLSEPITYTIIWNTPEECWVDLYIFKCINLGVTVTSISELYNPPLTNEELIEMIDELIDEDGYCVTYGDGEIISDDISGDCIGYAVAVDTFDYEHFFTVNYSTTNGSDITITVSD